MRRDPFESFVLKNQKKAAAVLAKKAKEAPAPEPEKKETQNVNK